MPLCTVDDISIYFRQHFDRLGIGSYHHEARLVDPWTLPQRAQLPFTAGGFRRGLGSDAKAPARASTRSKSIRGFNGMFAFTADHYPILGESPVKGLWSAVGAWLVVRLGGRAGDRPVDDRRRPGDGRDRGRHQSLS